MGATKPARTAALLIAVLAIAGFALPAIVGAAIGPPPAAAPSGLQAKPSERPTPKPKQTPTPIPTPVPTPNPTAPPGPTPAPTAAPTAAPTPAPTAGLTAGPTATRTPAPLPPASGAPGPAATPGTPAGEASSTPPASSDAAGGIVDGSGGASADGSPTSGFGRWPTDLAAPIGYAALVLFVAFIIARRRLARQERAALANAALANASPAKAANARPAIDPDSLPVQRFEDRTRPEVADDEADRPRWLRPSLRAERFGVELGQHRMLPAHMIALPPARAALAFGGVPNDLDDRRLVQAAGVALLDQPGADLGRRLTQLERGDEVAIIDRDGDWLNVLTPTGEAGWLPESALAAGGEALGASGQPAGQTEGPTLGPGAASTPPDPPFDLAALLAAGRPRDPGPVVPNG
jgi:hypothetical protein